MVYCVVAAGAPRKLVEALKRQYEEDPTVTVVIDGRRRFRRSSEERRAAEGVRGDRITERRRVRHPDGRRVAERRTVLGPCFREIELPRAARGHENEILFGSRLEPSRERQDDVAAARLALAHQAGDGAAFEALFGMWFDRAYTYCRTVHARGADIELAVNAAFEEAYCRLSDFAPVDGSFREWFGRIVAGVCSSHSTNGHGPADTHTLDRWEGPVDLEALRWLGDDELLVLIRQLPAAQREVVALHYVFGLNVVQVAATLGDEELDVVANHDRAVRFMSGCLTALSRRPGFSGRLPMRERRRYYPVTSGRKQALAA